MSFKKIVSISFFVAFLAIFVSSGRAEAGFWDWLKIGSDNQQAATSSLAKQYKLKVKISGVGKITGIGNSNAINCARSKDRKYSGTCKAKFNKGDTVVLMSESPGEFIDETYQKKLEDLKKCGPQPGVPGDLICENGKWRSGSAARLTEISPPETPPAIDGNFVSWGGACKVKKARICSVVMDSDKKVSAKFQKSELIPPVPPPILISPYLTSSPEMTLQLPIGINNAFAMAKEESSDYIKDLGVSWISDHLARRYIEKEKRSEIIYDFKEIDGQIKEYGAETKSNAWFIINIESKFKIKDGMIVGLGRSSKSEGKYLPQGPVSYAAYGKFLRALVNYVNTSAPGWKVKYWSIDNEHSSLYVPAFCGEEIKKDCGKKAAKAYADIMEYSYKIIKEIDPEAKIVFGGPAGATLDEEYEYYYKEALKSLKEKRKDGYFDFFDYHNFNVFKEYKKNSRDKGLEFFRAMLTEVGFPDKPIIIKAGATHSGKDNISKNKRLQEYQTETQQAGYLVKRFIYHIANGVKLILSDTVKEDEERQGTFSHNGLIYNGIPKQGECDSEKELPCPDPGDGVKKLSYYTFKKTVEVLKGSDWNNIQIIQEKDGVYVYKFIKNGKSIWVAWNDNSAEKQITISGIRSSSVKITEAVPKYESGENVTDYNTAFNTTETKTNPGGMVTIILSDKPVFVEEK